jgi:hypothetical protein
MDPAMERIRAGRARHLIGIVAAIGMGWGCAAGLGPDARYAWFGPPDADDAWSPKIRAWQVRELGDAVPGAPAQVGGSGRAAPVVDEAEAGDLRAKYDAFRSERKRELARELAAWIQSEAPRHYVADGAIDHWATLEETFRSNGDDCDGLELLAYHFLRDLGFQADEVFRAIVYRRSDGQHHMVTLWFEDATDPWVIDPTGAMTLGMPRMSEVPEWIPLKVFSAESDYTVRRERMAASATPDPGE